MLLKTGGVDIYYIDESHDRNVFVVTALRIPFLRSLEGSWHIVWPDHLSAAKQWRKRIKDDLNIPTTKELHGVKLLSGRGNFLYGKHNFKRKQAHAAFKSILADMPFVPQAGILSSAANRSAQLYGRDRLEAVMYALFQRMRRQCDAMRTNAVTFFDQGHPEYRRLYRMAQVHLPTGSSRGGWSSGPSKNMPMDMFTKDANEKNSRYCYFTQAVDLIAYSAFLKLKAETASLTDWQKELGCADLYDSIEKKRINLKVTNQPPQDGIVRLR